MGKSWAVLPKMKDKPFWFSSTQIIHTTYRTEMTANMEGLICSSRIQKHSDLLLVFLSLLCGLWGFAGLLWTVQRVLNMNESAYLDEAVRWTSTFQKTTGHMTSGCRPIHHKDSGWMTFKLQKENRIMHYAHATLKKCVKIYLFERNNLISCN